MAHPNGAQAAQTAPANQPNRHHLAPCHHERKINPKHQDAHQKYEMRACTGVPFFVYPYIPYTMEQPSSDDRQTDPKDIPTKDQKSPARHNCHTCPHAHHDHHHRCHRYCHHINPTPVKCDHKRNKRCYHDHNRAANSPQPQPRTSHSGNRAKHEQYGTNNDTFDEKNQNQTSPHFSTKWIWGPSLPGFVVYRPMNAPKYKHG